MCCFCQSEPYGSAASSFFVVKVIYVLLLTIQTFSWQYEHCSGHDGKRSTGSSQNTITNI